MREMERISVIGTGYVGLVSGVVFANWGHQVTCVDKDTRRVETLKRGESPICEPGLSEAMKKALKAGKIRFTQNLQAAIDNSDFIFIAVGTPDKGNGEADVSQIKSAIKELAKFIKSYKVIVVKSTVPVGTGEKIEEILQAEGVSRDLFDVVSNPEFLREGNALYDAQHPERIIVGGDKKEILERVSNLYSNAQTEVLFCERESSELIKYASNCFLAMKISFINSLSVLCERLGGDVNDVAKGMGLDSRIGHSFLNAGIGWGGSCFPKDVMGLLRQSEKVGYPFGLLRETVYANEYQTARFIETMERLCRGMNGKNVGIWGLSFKPNTDDVRDSRALWVCEELVKRGAKIKAYDPAGMGNFSKEFPEVIMCQSAYQCVEDADVLALLTEWNEFKTLDLHKVKKNMRYPIFMDARNVFSPEEMRRLGFTYWSFGRK